VCRNILDRISPSFHPRAPLPHPANFRKSVAIASRPVRRTETAVFQVADPLRRPKAQDLLKLRPQAAQLGRTWPSQPPQSFGLKVTVRRSKLTSSVSNPSTSDSRPPSIERSRSTRRPDPRRRGFGLLPRAGPRQESPATSPPGAARWVCPSSPRLDCSPVPRNPPPGRDGTSSTDHLSDAEPCRRSSTCYGARWDESAAVDQPTGHVVHSDAGQLPPGTEERDSPLEKVLVLASQRGVTLPALAFFIRCSRANACSVASFVSGGWRQPGVFARSASAAPGRFAANHLRGVGIGRGKLSRPARLAPPAHRRGLRNPGTRRTPGKSRLVHASTRGDLALRRFMASLFLPVR